MRQRTPLGAVMYGGAVLVGSLLLGNHLPSPRQPAQPSPPSTATPASRPPLRDLLGPPVSHSSPPPVAPVPLEEADLEAQWADVIAHINQLIQPCNDAGWKSSVRDRQASPTLREFRRLLPLARAGGPTYEAAAWQQACELEAAFHDARFQRDARKQLGAAAGSCHTPGLVMQAKGGTS